MNFKKAVVVLVEPSGNINVGSVARLCENFEIEELRLVSPKCDIKSLETKKMAMKGLNLLEKAKEYSTLIEAISDCRQVIATAGRMDHGDIPLHQSEEVFEWIKKTSSDHNEPIAMVFGREDRGLTNEELLCAQRIISLNQFSNYQSLNLSHAVAIVLYEYQKSKGLNPISKSKTSFNLAKAEELDNCLKDAENILLEIGFLMKHTSKARMSKFKGLLQRADIKSEEVALIRGVVRQIRWAINKGNI